jgi:hypothetical protein
MRGIWRILSLDLITESTFAMPSSAVRNETAFVLVLLATKVTSHGPCKLAVAVGNVSSQSLFPRVNFRTVRTLVD